MLVRGFDQDEWGFKSMASVAVRSVRTNTPTEASGLGFGLDSGVSVSRGFQFGGYFRGGDLSVVC